MFKSVIFDMDGVLVNTEPIHYKMYQEFLKEQGIDLEYEIYAPCIGSTVPYLRGLLLERYGIDILKEENKTRVKELEKQIIARDGYGEIAGIKEFLMDLKEKGIKTAVASSSFYDVIVKTVEDIGIAQYFDCIVSGADVAHPKPAPDVFLKAMEMLGCAPCECVIVEDSRNGVHAAKAAGAACMGFYNPDSGNQDLSKADMIVEGFEEIDTEFARKLHGRVFGIPEVIDRDI